MKSKTERKKQLRKFINYCETHLEKYNELSMVCIKYRLFKNSHNPSLFTNSFINIWLIKKGTDYDNYFLTDFDEKPKIKGEIKLFALELLYQIQ